MEPRTDLWLQNLKDERDGAALCEGLARLEKDPERAKSFQGLADGERRHAEVWSRKLERSGAAAWRRSSGDLPIRGAISARRRQTVMEGSGAARAPIDARLRSHQKFQRRAREGGRVFAGRLGATPDRRSVRAWFFIMRESD